MIAAGQSDAADDVAAAAPPTGAPYLKKEIYQIFLYIATYIYSYIKKYYYYGTVLGAGQADHPLRAGITCTVKRVSRLYSAIVVNNRLAEISGCVLSFTCT